MFSRFYPQSSNDPSLAEKFADAVTGKDSTQMIEVVKPFYFAVIECDNNRSYIKHSNPK
jgi:hypothetical protein